MSRNQASIDGFVPRRPGNQMGELHQVGNPEAIVSPIDRSLHTAQSIPSAQAQPGRFTHNDVSQTYIGAGNWPN